MTTDTVEKPGGKSKRGRKSERAKREVSQLVGELRGEGSQEAQEDANAVSEEKGAEAASPEPASSKENPAEPGNEATSSTEEPTTGEEPKAATPEELAEAKLARSLPMEKGDNLDDVEGDAAPELVSIVESLLFAAPKPLRVRDLHRVMPECSVRQIQLALKHLIQVREASGISISRVAGGFVMTTHRRNANWVQTLLQAKPQRLSRAQLESLALISYRQPITRPEMEHIRGVDCGAVLKVLLERDLVQIVGKKDEVGRPLMYGTTVQFLEFFNLMSLKDLPDLREFEKLSSETQAMLKNKMGEDDAERLGQQVLEFAAKDSAGADPSTPKASEDPEPVATTSEDDQNPTPSEAAPEPLQDTGDDNASSDEAELAPAEEVADTPETSPDESEPATPEVANEEDS